MQIVRRRGRERFAVQHAGRRRERLLPRAGDGRRSAPQRLLRDGTMRWMLGLLPFAVAASCSEVTGTPEDAGDEGRTSGPCSSNADCATGFVCQYPASDGCSATTQCMRHLYCKAAQACACDGTDILVCGGSPKPIAHLGSCKP